MSASSTCTAGVVYVTDVQPSGEIFEPDVGRTASDGGRLPVRFEGVREGLDVVATDDAVFVACQCNSGPSLLAYDPSTGAKLSTDGYAGYVQHLAVGGGRLYVAGGVGGYAAFDLATRTRVSWTAPVLGAQPRALAVGADGSVALGGTNGAVNGAVRNDLAAFDLRTGALLPFDPRPDTPNALPPKFPQVHALAKVGDTLYVGGEFTRIAGVARKNLAALDMRWRAALEFPEARGRVFDIAVAGNRLFAGGELLEAYDLGTRTKLAWELGPEYVIRALATVDDKLFIGGSFLWLDEGSVRHQRKYLAAFRTSDFAPVPVAEPNGWVYDLLADGAGGLWVGGGFTRLAGVLFRQLRAPGRERRPGDRPARGGRVLDRGRHRIGAARRCTCWASTRWAGSRDAARPPCASQTAP